MVFILPFSRPKDQVFKPVVISPFEEKLLAGLRVGDKNSIDLLYKNYSSSLFGIIIRIVKFDEIAEDVLQDTFLKIWKYIGQYDQSKGRLYTWMANLAKNTAIDQIRSKHYVHGAKTDDITTLAAENISKRPNDQFNLDAIGLKQLMYNLKPEHKQIIDLFYYQGYTHVEVAEHLNIPLGTVKTRIRQAILNLRQYFNETNSKLKALSA
ncbi:MAG: sigma-70 family RNA polymerase sigma factor [Pedobacter sp.]|nr:sigma-70 family RNA polymerase sigma factor [Pedobacter sp.]MDQ8052029.1 sigma-70 family RNA polymerase sigma factor [Pedobacter sp.]